MSKSNKMIVVAVLLVGMGFLEARGEGFPETSEVMRRLAEGPGDEAPEGAEAKEGLEAEIEQYSGRWGEMTAEEAAAGWLALVDKQAEAGAGQFGEIEVPFSELLEALPGPETWDALAEAVAARPEVEGAGAVRELSLRLLVAVLLNDKESQQAELEALAEQLDRMGGRRGRAMYMVHYFDQLRRAIGTVEEGGERVIEELESQIAAMERRRGDRDWLHLPDLVELVGEEKAEEILRRAVVLRGVEVGFDYVDLISEETQALARRVALELVDRMDVPQWQLAHHVNAVDLYEALEARFVRSREQEEQPRRGGLWSRLVGVDDFHDDYDPYEYEREEARGYYLLGLIIEGRSADAAAVARDLSRSMEEDEFGMMGRYRGRYSELYLPYEAMRMLDEAGHTRKVHDFFKELLRADPNLPLWDEYVSLSARVNETEAMLELVREASERENLTGEQRARVRGHLYQALLAADELDEAIAVMRAELGEEVKPEEMGQWSRRLEVGLDLAGLGHLLEQEQWIEEGLAASREAIRQLGRSSEYQWEVQHSTQNLASVLVEVGRGAEAAELLVDAMARQVQAARQQRRHYWGHQAGQDEAVELLGVYHHAGRHADVVELLETLPHWGVSDLAEIYANRDARQRPVGYMAAAALADQGRKEEALAILDVVLDAMGGFDPAYELLLEIGERDETMRRLDDLFSRDQFEERPLIWKAELLRRGGLLDEAEEVAMRAVAIDPSDGEQGRGYRMRVYTVLGAIHADRGDAEQARFFGDVMKAIRLAEDADRIYAAGLLRRGVEMYREALTHFADAYCIQSRLAIQLAELGRHDEAEEHYRRAYELMPDSFGRVESHCFGCEGAFSGERAQSIAEQVFTELLEQTPDKPQLHYLLGYLRQSQGKYDLALQSFRRAVELDPGYLNAWKMIQSMGRRAEVPSEERDRAILAMLKLDPRQRHARASLNEMSDLRALWYAVEEAAKWQVATPEKLYPLPASAEALAAREAVADEDDFWRIRQSHYPWRYDSTLDSPGTVIARHGALSAIGQLLDAQQHGW